VVSCGPRASLAVVTAPVQHALHTLPTPDDVVGASVVAFDPGRRVGVAWVTSGGGLLWSAVIAAEDLGRVTVPGGARVVLGDGTGSRALAAALAALGMRAEPVDERGTSEHARALYWRRHPPRGVGRMVPVGLRVPPRAIDDFAAYAIALRALGASARPRA
jgi:hypothetical protein